jgi:predicted nucleic acid-binding Zn ribbon protein
LPTYVYNILDKTGKPTGKQFEWMQSIKSEALTSHPETGESCSRAIVSMSIKHTGPAWNWCEDTKRYINKMKPKYIRGPDGKRLNYPKGGV